MARPEVKGLKYWNFDGNFYQDKKIRLLRGQHGAEGVEIYIRLLCKIYTDNGYYLIWDDKDDISLLADETGYPEEKVRLIVSTLLSRSLLESKLSLRGNVLTSRSIQRRYFEAIKLTKEKAAAIGRHIVIEKEICLLEDDDLKSLNDKKEWLFIGKKESKSENKEDKSENKEDKSENNSANKTKLNKTKPDKERGAPVQEKSHTQFIIPSLNEVLAYCKERNNTIDPQRFIDYYSAVGWVKKGNPIIDWKAELRAWEKFDKPQGSTSAGSKSFDTVTKKSVEELNALSGRISPEDL